MYFDGGCVVDGDGGFDRCYDSAGNEVVLGKLKTCVEGVVVEVKSWWRW